jgi:hypothetical protein
MDRTIWIMLLGTLAGCSSQPPGVTTAAVRFWSDDARLQMKPAWIETAGNSLVFHSQLVQPLDEGPLSPGAREYWWHFVIETDFAQWPPGWPSTHGLPIPPELEVALRWDGARYQAFTANRQPLVDGNPAVIRSLDGFQASGDQIAISVDRSLLVDAAGAVLKGFCFLGFGLSWADSPFDHTWLADDGTRLGLSGVESQVFAPFEHVYQPYGDATCPQ